MSLPEPSACEFRNKALIQYSFTGNGRKGSPYSLVELPMDEIFSSACFSHYWNPLGEND